MYLLSSALKKVNDAYPDVKIVLHEEKSDTLRVKAAEGKFDFAVINLPVDESVLDVIPLEQDTLILAVPEKHVPENISSSSDSYSHISFSDCKDMPFIVVGQSQEMRLLFEKLCSESDISPKITMEVVGLSTAWAMTKAGIGTTLLPLQFIKSTGVPKDIRIFIPDSCENIRQPAIVMRHGQYLSDYAKYAIKLLSDQETTK